MKLFASMIAVVLLLGACIARGEELNFQIVAPCGPPALAGKTDDLDFAIVRPPATADAGSRWHRLAHHLDFSIVGGDAPAESIEAAELPVVDVYSVPDERTCQPCIQARKEYAALKGKLPFVFQWKKSRPPAWITWHDRPTFIWRMPSGREVQQTGWPGMERFVQIFEYSQRAAARESSWNAIGNTQQLVATHFGYAKGAFVRQISDRAVELAGPAPSGEHRHRISKKKRRISVATICDAGDGALPGRFATSWESAVGTGRRSG